MHHYVYISWLEELFYIGSRSCACHPSDDHAYKGSGSVVTYVLTAAERKNMGKRVICMFSSRLEADEAESYLIEQFHDHPGCMNLKRSRRCGFWKKAS